MSYKLDGSFRSSESGMESFLKGAVMGAITSLAWRNGSNRFRLMMLVFGGSVAGVIASIMYAPVDRDAPMEEWQVFTPWTWFFAVLAVLSFVIGMAEAYKRHQPPADVGGPYPPHPSTAPVGPLGAPGAAEQRRLRAESRAQRAVQRRTAPQVEASAPVAPSPIYVAPAPREALYREDHGSFTVVDRRSFDRAGE